MKTFVAQYTILKSPPKVTATAPFMLFFFRLTVTYKDFLSIEKTNARRMKTQVPLLTLLEKMSFFTKGFTDLLRL